MWEERNGPPSVSNPLKNAFRLVAPAYWPGFEPRFLRCLNEGRRIKTSTLISRLMNESAFLH